MSHYSFLDLDDEQAYRDHYVKNYCQAGPVTTSLGFSVYFSPSAFDHAFFESTYRNGVKDTSYSRDRCRRMDWVRHTLTDPSSVWYQGWDNKTRTHNPTRTVCLAYGDFVVVLHMRRDFRGNLRGNFITCYWADNSIGKITRSPLWTPGQVPTGK